MPSPRLVTLVITTSHKARGPDVQELCALPLQQQFALDAPHQVVVHHAFSFADVPESPTVATLVFRYSTGFANVTAYETLSDTEGKIIQLVKVAFEVDEVYFATEVVDFKRAG